MARVTFETGVPRCGNCGAELDKLGSVRCVELYAAGVVDAGTYYDHVDGQALVLTDHGRLQVVCAKCDADLEFYDVEAL